MSSVKKWLGDMREIWLNKEPDRISDLLAEPLEYHETPFNHPLKRVDDVVSEWQAIKDQNIEYVDIELLYERDQTGVAIWRFKEYNQPLHIGCYFLKLNDEGKCIYFRQWWNSET